VYVKDSEDEGDEDYHFQLAIQKSFGFQSQNAEDEGVGGPDVMSLRLEDKEMHLLPKTRCESPRKKK
jgi:hypothetical protein